MSTISPGLGVTSVKTEPATVFGALLRKYRNDQRMSQSRLASSAGFDHSYVSRLEAGTRTPTREAIHQLALALSLGSQETDELLISAGFLPSDPMASFAHEPDVAQVYQLLTSEEIPDNAKETVRMQLLLIVQQVTTLIGVPHGR